VPKVLEKSRAIPVLTLRACVAYKKGENLPTIENKSFLQPEDVSIRGAEKCCC